MSDCLMTQVQVRSSDLKLVMILQQIFFFALVLDLIFDSWIKINSMAVAFTTNCSLFGGKKDRPIATAAIMPQLELETHLAHKTTK